jgi:hypothetical protein
MLAMIIGAEMSVRPSLLVGRENWNWVGTAPPGKRQTRGKAKCRWLLERPRIQLTKKKGLFVCKYITTSLVVSNLTP